MHIYVLILAYYWNECLILWAIEDFKYSILGGFYEQREEYREKNWMMQFWCVPLHDVSNVLRTVAYILPKLICHFYTHFHWKQGILTLIIRWWSMKNIQDRYIYSWSGSKNKTKIKINKNFFVWNVYTGNRIAQNFPNCTRSHEGLRS